MTYFPRLPGCQPLPRMHIPPLHSSLSPISGVPPLTSGRRLTSGRLASPHFPGCHPMPHIDISPLAFFSFPHFRGASLDFGAATHLGATCFPPLSGVHRHAFTNHLTSVTTCFPLLPGCQTMPRIDISPRKHFPSPTFRSAPFRHTDPWHLSLRNYFYGAENAQDFLRRR